MGLLLYGIVESCLGENVYSSLMISEMKITVCFGATKIVVPCGTQLPVRELIRQAVVRYKKVTNKVSFPNLNRKPRCCNIQYPRALFLSNFCSDD